MQDRCKIFLIGMPGSGKTSTGKILSDKLRLRFYDIDAELENDQAKSVSQIFTDHGEEYFRIIENKLLKKLISNNRSFVLASGGGTPCYYSGMEQMNLVGKTFYLEASLTSLLKRVSTSENRPLLGADNQGVLKKFLNDREQFYSQAHYTINTDNLVAASVAQKIKKVVLNLELI